MFSGAAYSEVPYSSQSVENAVAISVSAGTLALTGHAPAPSVFVSPAAGALALTGQAVAIETEAAGTKSPPAGSLTATGHASGIATGYASPEGTGNLTGQSLAVAINYSITIPLGTPTITGQDVLAAVPQFITGAVGTAALTGKAVLPVIGVVSLPAAGIGTVTGHVSAPSIAWAFPAGSVVASGHIPTLYFGQYIAVGAGSPAVTGQAFGNHTGIPVASAVLTVTGAAPVESQGMTIAVASAGSMNVTGAVPSIPLLSSPSYNVITIEALF